MAGCCAGYSAADYSSPASSDPSPSYLWTQQSLDMAASAHDLSWALPSWLPPAYRPPPNGFRCTTYDTDAATIILRSQTASAMVSSRLCLLPCAACIMRSIISIIIMMYPPHHSLSSLPSFEFKTRHSSRGVQDETQPPCYYYDILPQMMIHNHRWWSIIIVSCLRYYEMEVQCIMPYIVIIYHQVLWRSSREDAVSPSYYYKILSINLRWWSMIIHLLWHEHPS